MERTVTVLAEGLGFTEGPVVAPDGVVYITSVDQGIVYRIGTDGAVTVHGDVGGGPNGAVIDADGTLYIAQSGGRFALQGPRWRPDSVGGLQRITPDGDVGWVTRDPIAPNDLCFGPDHLIYMTDPTRAPQAPDGRLWRTDPMDGATELLRSVRWFSNGIGFGLDDALYVASTHTSQIIRVDVETGAEEVVIQMTEGKPDGFAFDAAGNLVIAALSPQGPRGSIQTWSLGGELLDVFYPGEGKRFTNVAFTHEGGLIVSDSGNDRVLVVNGWGPGSPLHPFRT